MPTEPANGRLPLVSIVVPTYNRADLLGECLRSALAVRWQRLEVIVVDDGSTDHTETIVRSFGERVRYQRLTNGGAANARNVGLHLARGEWVQFLDSDDLLLPTKLEVEVPILQQTGSDMVFGDYAFFKEEPGHFTRTFAGRDAGADWITFFLAENTQTAVPLHRRETLIAQGGWRLDCLCVDDYELHLRRAFKGARIRYAPGVRSIARDHGGERFSANPKGNKAMRRVLVEYGHSPLAAGLLTPERAGALAGRLWRVVQGELQAGRPASARQAFADLRALVPDFQPPRSHPLTRSLARLVGPLSLESLKWSFRRPWALP